MNAMLPNQVRIIGGKWRGRKVHFTPFPTLRPTPDRIRETLFNWLAKPIIDAQCLDLFAGSGALGFEALSRGASQVCFVDQERKIIQTLRENAERFVALNDVTLIQADVPWQPLPFTTPFDIVFLDPPFAQELLIITLTWLLQQHYVHASSLIYIEAERELKLSELPGFNVIRHQQTATLQFGLLEVVS